METILHFYRPLALTLLALASFAISALAQVSVPDPALKAVICKAAQKPVGPLTREDLLILNGLDV